MDTQFLLYGSNGFVGREIADRAVQSGLQPVLAGRNADKIKAQAAALNLDYHVFNLDDAQAIDRVLQGLPVVLHCAGPYIYTSKPIADACLRTGAHYLDITGEIPVYTALADRDAEAKRLGVMLMPGVGFDVVPTDCLAVHLKERLPTATHLALAFHSRGPARIPPGTANTMVEMMPYGAKIRRNGQLESFPIAGKSRWIDFGRGPRQAFLFPWGDVFTAYYSTGIPNIEVYASLPPQLAKQWKLFSRLIPLFRSSLVRRIARRFIPTGSTPEQRAQTSTHVWGEVEDDQGRKAAARLHGPEAGVEWTTLTAIEAVRRVLAGDTRPGFQTPGSAFGADFVLAGQGVVREDL